MAEPEPTCLEELAALDAADDADEWRKGEAEKAVAELRAEPEEPLWAWARRAQP